MAQIKENLPNEVIETLISNQNEIAGIVMEIGQITLRNRELRTELDKNNEIKLSMETKFDELNEKLNDVLRGLEEMYPKGEIDLKQGVVYFEKD